MNYIQTLPREILGEILAFCAHLTDQPQILSLRNVCKKFREVLDRCTIWQTLADKYLIKWRAPNVQIKSFDDFYANRANLAIPVRGWIGGRHNWTYINQENMSIVMSPGEIYTIAKYFDLLNPRTIMFTLTIEGSTSAEITLRYYDYNLSCSFIFYHRCISGSEHEIVVDQYNGNIRTMSSTTNSLEGTSTSSIMPYNKYYLSISCNGCFRVIMRT